MHSLRVFSIILALCIVMLVLSCVLLSNHDCNGEDCEICLRISDQRKTLSIFIILSMAVFAFAEIVKNADKAIYFLLKKSTIVSEKVKISD